MNASKLVAALVTTIIATNFVFARGTDWSMTVVDSTIKRYPTAESLKGWGYAKSLYLYGEYLVYLRTKDKK